MRIVAISGSPKEEKSKTYLCITRFKEYLEHKFHVESCKIFTIGKDVYPCRGCLSCFHFGVCPINDKMLEIKKGLLEADIIILGSPVYFHNISGNMKIFIDRISYWSHYFELAGKLGFVISQSESNGNAYVEEYLKKFLDYCGVYTVDSLSSLNINSKIEFEYEIEHALISLDYTINNIDDIVFENQNEIYNAFKSIFSSVMLEKKEGHYEANIWKDKGYMKMGSFKEIFLQNFQSTSFTYKRI